MILFITSKTRISNFLLQDDVQERRLSEKVEIRNSLALINGREWQEIIVTIDVEDKLRDIMQQIGTEFLPDKPFQIFTEDDLPQIGLDDYVIAIHDDGTITTANRKMKKAA